MPGKWRMCLVGVALALGLRPCAAAVYFVDQASPAAADANPGSEAEPFTSISAAAAVLKPGDTLYVKDGTYREDVFLPAGEADAPVTLSAYPGDHPVVTGCDLLAGPWEPAEIEPTTPPPGGEAPAIYRVALPVPAQMVFVDGAPVHQIGPFDIMCPPQHMKFDGAGPADMRPGTFCYDAEGGALYLWLADGSNPADHRVEVQQRLDGIRMKDYNHVIGFEARGYGAGINKGQMGIGGSGTGLVIDSCRCVYNEFAGIIVQGDDCVVRNCEMAHNGYVGLTTSTAHRLLMEGNVTHENNARGVLPGWLDGGVKLHEAHDARILRHYGYDEPGTALWLDISCIGALIADCRFDNCANGVYYEISRWGVIVNNVLRGCSVGIWSYSSDVLIAHNVLDRCSHGIVVTGDPRLAEYSMGYPDPQHATLAATRNNMVVNNIIIDSVAAYTGESKEDPDCGPNLIDYNVYVWLIPTVANGGQHIGFIGNWNTYYGGLGNWWVAMHQDGHSMIADPTLRRIYDQRTNQYDTDHNRVVGDPMFRSREGGDYRLMPESPIRGFGRAVPPLLKSVRYAGRRPWEKTLLADAPEPKPTEGVFEVWGEQHYRHQPEPEPLMMFEPDAQPPVAPGLVEEWSRDGSYPRFEMIEAPE
jgi:hypothetical protein